MVLPYKSKRHHLDVNNNTYLMINGYCFILYDNLIDKKSYSKTFGN